MGIGRREFIRLTSIALAGFAVSPLQAVVTNNNVYINKKLGILFHKPTKWGFISVKDFGKLKEEQIFANHFDLTKQEVFNDLEDPIVIATKYFKNNNENVGVFSPTITLNIQRKSELEHLKYESFEELIYWSEMGLKEILKEFTVLKRHDPYTLAGSKFYEFDSEYLFEHVEISEPLKVELKTLRTEHNGLYYDFNCHQCSAQNQTADREFQQFIESIKLI